MAHEGMQAIALEVHDLAASKLAASREKDKVFVITLLNEKLLVEELLLQRVEALPLDVEKIQSITNWLSITAEEIGQ